VKGDVNRRNIAAGKRLATKSSLEYNVLVSH